LLTSDGNTTRPPKSGNSTPDKRSNHRVNSIYKLQLHPLRIQGN
jgi:hypothetical protein